MKIVIPASEAARMLGMDNNAFLKMLERGEIPAYRKGRNWKIPMDLLKATVENKAIKEAQERRRLYEMEKGPSEGL